MITDEQGKNWLLQKLYDNGWRYYAKNVGGTAFLTTKKPIMGQGILEITSGGTTKCINIISEIMPEIDRNGLVDIAEELGIVDWSKVSVDTPVRVWNNESTTKEKRHFAGYENGYVLTWYHGGTSWSSPKHCVSEWDHAELVEL